MNRDDALKSLDVSKVGSCDDSLTALHGVCFQSIYDDYCKPASDFWERFLSTASLLKPKTCLAIPAFEPTRHEFFPLRSLTDQEDHRSNAGSSSYRNEKRR